MLNLLKTEWLKLRKYPAFWWIIGLTALSYPGIVFIYTNIYRNITHREGNAAQVLKAMIGNPFSFPEAWHTLAYGTCFFVFIPAVVVIMFITNEYTYKTHRQNIIDGWSRNQFMTSKMLDVLIVSICVTLLYLIATLVTGFVYIDEARIDKWDQAYYIGLFALQTFAQLSIAFLIGFLIRKAFIALGVFLFYFLILEPIFVGLLKYKFEVDVVAGLLPLEISDRLIPVPAFLGKIDKASYDKAVASINIHILYTFIITAIIWWLCFRINNKRDL